MTKIRAKFPSATFGLLKYSCALSFNAKVTEKVGGNSIFYENDYLHTLFYNDRFPMAFTICKSSASSFSILSYVSVVTDLSYYLLVLCSGSRLPSFMSPVTHVFFFF